MESQSSSQTTPLRRALSMVGTVTDMFACPLRTLASRHGLPYSTGSMTRRFGTTWLKSLRLAFPGGESLAPA